MPNLLTDTEIVNQLAALIAQPTEITQVRPGYEYVAWAIDATDGFWRGVIQALLSRRRSDQGGDTK